MHNRFLPLKPHIVLGVAAHPDDLDVDVDAGGTLAHFAAKGAMVHYLILTDGGKEPDDPSMSSNQLTAASLITSITAPPDRPRSMPSSL